MIQLRAFLTEPMLDQIPMLGDLQRYLEHLSMMEPPAPKREVILEQVGTRYHNCKKNLLNDHLVSPDIFQFYFDSFIVLLKKHHHIYINFI